MQEQNEINSLFQRIKKEELDATVYTIKDWSLNQSLKDDQGLIVMFDFYQDWIIDQLCIVKVDLQGMVIKLYVFHDGAMDIIHLDSVSLKESHFDLIQQAYSTLKLSLVTRYVEDGALKSFALPLFYNNNMNNAKTP